MLPPGLRRRQCACPRGAARASRPLGSTLPARVARPSLPMKLSRRPPRHTRGETGETMDVLERETMRKVALRLLPYLMLCYFFCFLDRVNVGFAALQMNQDLGFTQTVFGFG